MMFEILLSDATLPDKCFPQILGAAATRHPYSSPDLWRNSG